ncbi:hypothetical protein, partial [Leuconostoc lactis]|uniref:hypothetical protein n=1 Tax=Leuconostoc lactis TaxID=1246 RepID=UPI0025B1D0A1
IPPLPPDYQRSLGSFVAPGSVRLTSAPRAIVCRMTDPIALTASLIFMFVAGFVVGYAVRAAISRRRRARAR